MSSCCIITALQTDSADRSKRVIKKMPWTQLCSRLPALVEISKSVCKVRGALHCVTQLFTTLQYCQLTLLQSAGIHTV